MIQIICLIMGIIYALRRPKLISISNSAFPNVPGDKFGEWKRYELKSIDVFLWASWGIFVLSIIAMVLSPGGALQLQIVFLVLFFLLLVIAAVFGSKAAKLKKQFGIKWP